MAYNKKVPVNAGTTAAQAIAGMVQPTPPVNARRTVNSANQRPTDAWLNIQVIDKNGDRHNIQTGIALSSTRGTDRALMKAIGVNVANITYDDQGLPVFEGDINEDREFSLVGTVKLVQAAPDIEL